MRDPLDPALVDLVTEFEARDLPRWHEQSVAEARALEADLFTPDDAARDPVGAVTTQDVEGPNGDVPVRIYTPDATPPHDTLVFCHGGGWMLGTLDSADDLCRGLCRRTDRIVVSVDYRLAPEHPFPDGLTDAIAVLEWVGDDPPALPAQTGALAVAGTSAGGNLAAGLARYSVEYEHAPTVEAQLLLYPMLDPATDRPSHTENADAPFLVPEDVEWFWTNYLRHEIDTANPYAVPLGAPIPAALPPAIVATAGHDPLRDEGVAYVDALTGAGITVDHHHYPTLCHGFLSMSDDVPAADDAFDELADSLD